MSEIKSVRSELDKKLYTYTIISGDNLSKIADKNNTTIDELRLSNPSQTIVLKIGGKLKYHKAEMHRVITNWRPVSSVVIAKRYNVGDDDYSKKLDYIMNEVFPEKMSKENVK